MAKPILISGIQPSGRLHLGNYLGALKNFVDLQKSGKYQCYFFLADLHSLTEYPADAKTEAKQILELAADYLAVGLDPKKSVIFQQSQIPAHSELAWILNTITPMGELRRMTQFKEKAGPFFSRTRPLVELFNPEDQAKAAEEAVEGYDNLEKANAGLFAYPVLMAADIILYDAKFVPVGEDQVQHLELTRTLARKFNKKFGKTFVEPQPLLTETSRVMSLKNPEKKMSKSQPDSCLFLDDSPEEVKAKVMRATTDSGSEIKHDPHHKKGVSNMLGIYSALSGQSIPTLEKKFADKTYSEFKSSLAALIADHFADYRKSKKQLLAKPATLKQVLAMGSAVAAKTANRKIAEVKKRVGLA